MHLRLRFFIVFLAAFAGIVAGNAVAQTALIKDSPFLPPGTASDDRGLAPSGAFELAGASVTSGGAEVCIYDAKKRHSRWIGVGATDGDIQVLSYDAQRDRTVLRISGVQQVLELRRESAAPASRNPGSVATSPAVEYGMPPAAAGAPPEIGRQARDARMLVNDLMEIGAQQRKAYQEAQRKKAADAGK
jgi:hypothetical protein